MRPSKSPSSVPSSQRKQRTPSTWQCREIFTSILLVVSVVLILGKITAFIFIANSYCQIRGGKLCQTARQNLSVADPGGLGGQEFAPLLGEVVLGDNPGGGRPPPLICGWEDGPQTGFVICTCSTMAVRTTLSEDAVDGYAHISSQATGNQEHLSTADNAGLTSLTRLSAGSLSDCGKPCSCKAELTSKTTSFLGSTTTTEAYGRETVLGVQTGQVDTDSSGKPTGLMRGLVWNSCMLSAVLLVLVAIGVVVFL